MDMILGEKLGIQLRLCWWVRKKQSHVRKKMKQTQKDAKLYFDIVSVSSKKIVLKAITRGKIDTLFHSFNNMFER